MSPGHRVERVHVKTAKTARRRVPWAEVVVRVGADLFVAYEAKEDAEEEHATVYRPRVNAEPIPARFEVGLKPGTLGGLFCHAKRRGDLA